MAFEIYRLPIDTDAEPDLVVDAPSYEAALREAADRLAVDIEMLALWDDLEKGFFVMKRGKIVPL